MEAEYSNEPKPRAGGRIERVRLFVSEVRNELKRVSWPSGQEVYATTVVVIVTSVLLGVYLWGLDLIADRLRIWLFRRFIG
jgi:preprotein translocase subunit SecE